MQKRHPISHSFIRQAFILGAILFLGYFIFKYFTPYFSGIFGAIIMFVITKDWMRILTNNGWKRWISATLLILFSIFIIILPLAGLAFMLGTRVQDFINNSEKYIFLIESNIASLEDYLGIDLTTEIGNPRELLTSSIQSWTEGTLDIFISLGILYFVLYYLLINYDILNSKINEYIPISDENFNRISVDTYDIVKSNAIAIPLVALLQGLVALIGYFIFDAPNPLFWFALTTIGSMIPFVGTAIGMIPLILIMYTQGQTFDAIALAIYGMAIVGSTDNVFRIIVQKKLAEIHPLITLFGVIIGIPMFGFLGLVFGPLLVSLFLLLLKIYKEEYYPKQSLFHNKKDLPKTVQFKE